MPGYRRRDCILNTLEISDVPGLASAGQAGIDNRAQRLLEMMEVCR